MSQFPVPPPNGLFCAVCQDIFRDPIMIITCQHTFCFGCLEQLKDNICPLCRQYYDRKSDLVSNLAIRQIVGEVQVYCSYKNYGCDSKLSMDTKHDHEKNCDYRPVLCTHAEKGCQFQGISLSLKSHLTSCPFESLKTYLSILEHKMASMQETIKSQAKDIAHLKSMLLHESDSPKLIVPMKENRSIEDISGLSTGELQCQMNPLSQKSSGVTSLAYFENTLYSGGHDGSLRVWDIRNFSQLKELTIHSYTVWSLVVHSSSKRLFSASSDGTIKVWDISKNDVEPIQTMKSHNGRIFCLSLDGKSRLASGSSDRTVKVYDLETLECTNTFVGHTDGINAVAWINDKYVVSGGNDSQIKVWDLEKNEAYKTITNESEVLSLAVHSDYLFAASYDSNIYVYKLSDYSLKFTLKGHKWEVWQLVCIGNTLFSGSFDHTIKRWNITKESIENTATLLGHKGYIHAITLGDNCLITGCADKKIRVFTK